LEDGIVVAEGGHLNAGTSQTTGGVAAEDAGSEKHDRSATGGQFVKSPELAGARPSWRFAQQSVELLFKNVSHGSG